MSIQKDQLSNPIPTRFPKVFWDRLCQLAELYHIPQSALLRMEIEDVLLPVITRKLKAKKKRDKGKRA